MTSGGAPAGDDASAGGDEPAGGDGAPPGDGEPAGGDGAPPGDGEPAGDDAIRALIAANPGQATFDEYKLVRDVVLERAPCAMLVFGVGRDSALWLDANVGGRCVFLEDVGEWADRARGAVPGIVVHDVHYGLARRFMWPLLRRFERSLLMDGLPADVRETAWDVILVDAPRGTRWYRPGRMKSVYTASVLGARSGADVFVHDCHRRVERESADLFLGASRLVAEARSMRHYRLG
jgi:glucuronoxylan 4-O-methyltransferase